jgi:pentatricopeptide repeat-containing protein PET309
MLDKRKTRDPGAIGKAGTRLWSKIDATWTKPTYNVMVYLASALRDFKRRSLYVGTVEMDDLYSAAPKTMDAIAAMPYLRDKFQGVLLRDQPEKIDRHKSSVEPYVWTGGILGIEGQSRRKLRTPEDHARYELSEIEAILSSRNSNLADVQKRVKNEDGSEVPEYGPDEIDSSERVHPPEEEHDIELETTIEMKRRELGIDLVRDEAVRDQKK